MQLSFYLSREITPKGLLKKLELFGVLSGVSYLTGTGSACMHKAFWILFSVLVEGTLQNLDLSHIDVYLVAKCKDFYV